MRSGLTGFRQDLRYTLRGFRQKPGFVLAVVITLGLGIGANATMFGVVDRLLFRPPNMLIAPSRATRVYLMQTFRGKEYAGTAMSYRRFLDLRDRTASFELMAPFYRLKVAIGVGEAAREVNVGVSDAALWQMFDVTPAAGRFFRDDENVPTSPTPVFVISYGYWQTQYGGRPDVIGKTVLLGRERYTIIGVSPRGFNGFESEPLIGFVPLAAAAGGRGSASDPWYLSYRSEWVAAFGRRRSGVSPDVATSDLTRAFRESYEQQLARSPSGPPLSVIRPHALAAPVLRDRGPDRSNDAKVATWLAGVSLVVLLIACANVANLLLARALARQREIAVRLALGVSRRRLLTQLATESLALSVLGGAAGLGAARWGGALVEQTLLGSATASAVIDARVIAIAIVLAVVAGLLAGIAPIIQAGRTDIAASLKAGARNSGAVSHSRARAVLLATQAALSVILLVGAGLFVRSLANVEHTRLGFDAEQLLYVQLNARGERIDSAQQVALRDMLVSRARGVPGVANAARALTVPFWENWTRRVYVEGVDTSARIGETMTLQVGSPELFATMGTRIVRGRGLQREDSPGAQPVIIVNESMAKRLWPNADALGRCVRLDDARAPCRTVVGVAEDVRSQSLFEPRMHYYVPSSQFLPAQGGVFVRTHGDASAMVETVRRALQASMPGVSFASVTPMTTILAPRTRSWRLGATMFTVFGVLALGVAALGLYSVIAFNTAQRMHEMGIRVALGAEQRDVRRLIVREGLAVVVPGVAVGAALAVAAGKRVEPLLFDVSPTDPLVFAAVIATLIGVAIAGSWIPAVRASRVDPNIALRAE